MPVWIDTHCHLDASEFDADRDAQRALARAGGVELCVLPAVSASNLETVRELAHRHGDVYALGIHPLFTPLASQDDLQTLALALQQYAEDPRLIAVGEIGLDGFVPGLDMARQQLFYKAQLKLAQQHNLPVVLHVRRSADLLLQGLRQTPVKSGIAHAFNGSLQQAQQFIAMCFKLGFGGALTFERANQLRMLATQLPLDALVLETDSPDQPMSGEQGKRNEPSKLVRVAEAVAEIRGMSVAEVAGQTGLNAKRLFGLAA